MHYLDNLIFKSTPPPPSNQTQLSNKTSKAISMKTLISKPSFKLYKVSNPSNLYRTRSFNITIWEKMAFSITTKQDSVFQKVHSELNSSTITMTHQWLAIKVSNELMQRCIKTFTGQE